MDAREWVGPQCTYDAVNFVCRVVACSLIVQGSLFIDCAVLKVIYIAW